ncbi:hypothetical protein PD653_2588 [Nocardioides sp. PD653]|nr:hypothetical protein PD653B2_1273 [Nocardioides sp. PD653-B2]GAW55169.1 hypothetical protein PD653_2588 [Nocardioides sp. PD653]
MAALLRCVPAAPQCRCGSPAHRRGAPRRRARVKAEGVGVGAPRFLVAVGGPEVKDHLCLRGDDGIVDLVLAGVMRRVNCSGVSRRRLSSTAAGTLLLSARTLSHEGVSVR